MLPESPWSSQEFTGKLSPQISIFNFGAFLCCPYRQYFPPQIKCISFAVIKRINQDIQYIKDINIYFFVRKRYILLLFSTKKVHNVTFQYKIDIINYFFAQKIYILILFSTKKAYNVTFQYIIDTIHNFFVRKIYRQVHIVTFYSKRPLTLLFNTNLTQSITFSFQEDANHYFHKKFFF